MYKEHGEYVLILGTFEVCIWKLRRMYGQCKLRNVPGTRYLGDEPGTWKEVLRTWAGCTLET